MCSTSLLGGGPTYLHTVLVGELAHNVGATATPGSPRGQAEDIEDRESEENLLLLCHACHRLIDNVDHAPYFTTDRLRAIKKTHEDRVQHAATSGGMRRTAVLRVGGWVRDAHAMATQRQTADALLAEGYLGLVGSRWQGDFKCAIPGNPSRRSYWTSAQDHIDEHIALVKQALASGEVDHLSVFAIASVPLLVHLGSRLDDKTEMRIYPKHRDESDGWRWKPSAPVRDFKIDLGTPNATATDVVLALSVTAPFDRTKLPPSLASAPVVEIAPDDEQFGPNVISHRQTLKNFYERWSDLLTQTEAAHPAATRWHLFAATPITAAVEAGRALMRGAQPPVEVYHRDNDHYDRVLTVNE
jgi:hypothetical protein